MNHPSTDNESYIAQQINTYFEQKDIQIDHQQITKAAQIIAKILSTKKIASIFYNDVLPTNEDQQTISTIIINKTQKTNENIKCLIEMIKALDKIKDEKITLLTSNGEQQINSQSKPCAIKTQILKISQDCYEIKYLIFDKIKDTIVETNTYCILDVRKLDTHIHKNYMHNKYYKQIVNTQIVKHVLAKYIILQLDFLIKNIREKIEKQF